MPPAAAATVIPFAILPAVVNGSGRAPLFLRPTGLADGLAPKERRYESRTRERTIRFAPEMRTADSNLRSRNLFWFPRSPRLVRGDSAGLQVARQYTYAFGRHRHVRTREATSCDRNLHLWE
jgi:hypothetical protein